VIRTDSTEPISGDSEARTGRSLYRCPTCKLIQNGPEGKHGDLCDFCGIGNLTVISKVTDKMRRESRAGA
jgi:hypothetical protein